MKLMHDVHIWPTDIHVHDTEKSHGGLFSLSFFFFKSSIKCFIPEISMIAKWDEESTLLRRIKHATIQTQSDFKESLIVKTNKHKKMTIGYTNNALLITLRHLKQKGFVKGLKMVWLFKAILCWQLCNTVFYYQNWKWVRCFVLLVTGYFKVGV